MTIKKSFFISSIFACIVNTTAFADMSVMNNTSTPLTGSLRFSWCSSHYSDGIANPGESIKLTDEKLKNICKVAKNGYIYSNNSCAGKEIAIVTLDPHSGITHVENKAADEFEFVGSGMNWTVNPVHRGFMGWIRKFL